MWQPVYLFYLSQLHMHLALAVLYSAVLGIIYSYYSFFVIGGQR